MLHASTTLVIEGEPCFFLATTFYARADARAITQQRNRRKTTNFKAYRSE